MTALEGGTASWTSWPRTKHDAGMLLVKVRGQPLSVLLPMLSKIAGLQPALLGDAAARFAPGVTSLPVLLTRLQTPAWTRLLVLWPATKTPA